eukprot:g1039.t1
MNCRLCVFVLSVLVYLSVVVDYIAAANIKREWKRIFGQEGYCHLQCIQDIFAESCQGMNCTIIYEGTTEDGRKACETECILAVTSSKMRQCLKEGYPQNRVDWMMELSFYHYPGSCYNKYEVEDVYGGSLVSLEFDEFLEFHDLDNYYG